MDGVRWSVNNQGMTEEDTRDKDRWQNSILDGGKPL
jgi:hypothetical protein